MRLAAATVSLGTASFGFPMPPRYRLRLDLGTRSLGWAMLWGDTSSAARVHSDHNFDFHRGSRRISHGIV
jgi:hypothetical protein